MAGSRPTATSSRRPRSTSSRWRSARRCGAASPDASPPATRRSACSSPSTKGALVGFASFGPFRVPAGAPVLAGEGELQAIYLLARAQRLGLGRALFDAGTRWLREQRGCDAMSLWVIAGNAGAEAFYRRLGGVPIEDKTFEAHDRTLTERRYRFTLTKDPPCASTFPSRRS